MTGLTLIPETDDQFRFFLAYGTPANVTGRAIYAHSHCYLHPDAHEKLRVAAEIAASLGYTFLLWDAYRPPEAQQALWDMVPDPRFITPPEKGSPHSRGVAIDLTLCDKAGNELDMGTGFDDFTTRAFHTCRDVSQEAQRNRLILLGIMTLAGWDFYANEWWHYQLFNARTYPMIQDGTQGKPMMSQD